MQIGPVAPGGTGRLNPDANPRNRAEAYGPERIFIVGAENGTGAQPEATSEVGKWNIRWRMWRDGFESSVSANVKQYWALWRNFEQQATANGPGQDWRDRTIIPEPFKIIETRMPRKVLGLWGNPEPFGIRGRGFRDEEYEDMVFELLQNVLDTIGTGDPKNELFLKREIDRERYRQIMGHVFVKVMWKKRLDWLKTKQLVDKTWTPIELLEVLYDNVDVSWYGLDSVAIDLSGARRWIIERIQTSKEALELEDENFRKANPGMKLYDNLDQLETVPNSPMQQDQYSEPRDTEGWPLDSNRIINDPFETPVELWLCWDNVRRTLTKIANRSVQLDHGVAPTPYGFDPFISLPAIPVPGRVYGDSILNWVGPLAKYQTRIARARADEILLNIWQQYIYREGTVKTTAWFWRPGGGMPIDAVDDSRPISDHFALLPRRPVFQEAWQEEGYRQQQAESTAAADAVSQGIEATQKSRDVSATEIQQRVLQGSSRYELERLYDEVAYKKPLLGMIFDLLRQNLTRPMMVRILGDQEDFVPIDLRQIQRPIDITVTGGALDISHAEKLQELDRLINLDGSPNFSQWIKHRETLIEMLKSTRALRRNTKKFVLTEQEKQQNDAKMAMAQAGKGPVSGAAPEAGLPTPGAGESAPGATAGPEGQTPPNPEAGAPQPQAGTSEEI